MKARNICQIALLFLLCSCDNAYIKPTTNMTASKTYKILIRHAENDKLITSTKEAVSKLKSSMGNKWSYSITFQTFETDEEYLQATSGYDLFTAPYGNIDDYITDNKIADLSSYTSSIDYKDGYRSNMAELKYDDKVYGIPYNLPSIGVIYYNQEIFDNIGLTVPKTKTEFLNVCQTIKEYNETNETNIAPFASSLKADGIWQTSIFIDGLALTYDNKAASKLAAKTINFSSTAYKKALELYETMIKEGYVNSSTSAGEKGGYYSLISSFFAGNIAMIPGFSNNFQSYNLSGFNKLNVMYFPSLKDDREDYGVNLPSQVSMVDGLCVSSNVTDVTTAAKIAAAFSTGYGKWFYKYGDNRAQYYDVTGLSWPKVSVIPCNGNQDFITNTYKINSISTLAFDRFDNSQDIYTTLCQNMLYNYLYSSDSYSFNSILADANTKLTQANIKKL